VHALMRFMVRPGLLTAWANSPLGVSFADSDIAAGQPGVGAYGTPASGTITNVSVGPLDRVAPNAINPQTAGVAAFPNRIEMQWPGVTDDPDGIGLAWYQVTRDGIPLGTTPTPADTVQLRRVRAAGAGAALHSEHGVSVHP